MDEVKSQDVLQHVRVVMVGTSHPGNIGAAARAMKVMGIDRLSLVSPKSFPHAEAFDRAAHAREVVATAAVYPSLKAALSECTLVVGTSARSRRIPWPMVDSRAAAQRIYATAVTGQQVALVFGREATGLSNEELSLCHLHAHVPTAGAYHSLNVAAAVQVMCYEVAMHHQIASQALGTIQVTPDQGWDVPLATSADVEQFYEHSARVLTKLGVLMPRAPRRLMVRLRRLFSRTQLDTMEVNLLRGILTEIERLSDSR